MTLPLAAVFADVPDPRRETRNKRHALTDVLTLATCAVISGAESWDDIHAYAVCKQDFFRRFLSLANGIPSADTFERVFAKLNPAPFAAAFGRWMRAACEGPGLIPSGVDGKSVRGAEADTATGCLHLVSAWATTNRLTLGQVSVPDGSNEGAAIPELLRVLELTGAIVTIDAAGCQIDNAAIIRNAGGHYLLAAKANQPTLRAVAEGRFADALAGEFVGVDHHTHVTTETGHGRTEERCVTVLYHPVGLPADWADVDAVVRVLRERVVDGVRTSATHYYLTSHAGTAEELGGVIRGHWGVEAMHWCLDVVYGEDDRRVRAGHAGANLAMVRKVAIALTRRAPGKGSGKTKRNKAGWDDAFLLQVLQGIPPLKAKT
jgi:predicted transposase YbfD/YdcC